MGNDEPAAIVSVFGGRYGMATGMVESGQPLPPEDRVRQLFGRVQHQVDRMERMVFDFLDAARIEAGNLELQMERCDARELARAIVDLFEPAARTHQLVAEVPEGTDRAHLIPAASSRC